MICKKCGRVYEDDMPKCLWCDAPNENKASPANFKHVDDGISESTSIHSECDVRAERAIYWLKTFFFINLIYFILPMTFLFWGAPRNPIEEFGIPTIVAGCWLYMFPLYVGATLIGIIFIPFIWLSFLPLTIMFVVSLCKCIKYYCSWFYFSEKEQQHFTKKKYSPRDAVFFSLFPIVGPVFQFFIFRGMLAWQKESVEKNYLDYANLSSWVLPIFLITGVVMHVGFLIVGFISTWFTGVWFASVFSCIVLFICYLKIIRTITVNACTIHSLTANN